jgi:hypothetical protein
MNDEGGRLPIPDPTLLTTAALLREVNRVEALFEVRVSGVEDVVVEKLKALDERFIRIEQALEWASEREAQRFDSMKREMELITDAAATAITKVEAATDKRFEGVNEWRGQSADRERSQQEELAKLTSQFSLREVVDAQITDLRRSLEDLRDKVNKVV